MATSPNFNWPEPDNTDLVKNGALAIRTAVNAIDTSLVDLKGGTTGQVLAKASNTDMDFVWSADAGAPESLGFTAGKNKFINGDFGVNQRNFSSTTTDGDYTFDRWRCALASGTVTWSSQTFTPGAAPVAGYEGKNFLRSVVSGQTTQGQFAFIAQRIEDVRSFAGQTVTVSFWAKAASGTPKIGITRQQNFGSGGSPSATVETNAGLVSAITTSWARYSVSFAVPSISGKTIGTTANTSYLSIWLVTSAGTDYTSLMGAVGLQNNTIDIWGVQIEAGSTATAFQTATGTIQGELAACQRYYLRETASASYTFSVFAPSGLTSSTTRLIAYTTFPVQMRTVPISVEYGGSLTAQTTSGGQIVTSIALGDRSSDKIASVNYNVASGFTVNNFGFVRAENDATAYVGFNAEL
jgi:hypothetical protein